MRTRTGPNGSADKHVKEIKRKTRRQFSAEEKIRIVLDGCFQQQRALAAVTTNVSVTDFADLGCMAAKAD